MPNDGLFPTNSGRRDPYKNYRFLVYWGDSPDCIAAVSKVSAIKRTTEVIEHRHGGSSAAPRKCPAQIKYDPITLERGITLDLAFEQWALECNKGSAMVPEMELEEFRKDVAIHLLDEAGELVMIFKLADAWVSEFSALPELDSNQNGVAIESIVLQYEGFEREIKV